jgi:hypothetical protein
VTFRFLTPQTISWGTLPVLRFGESGLVSASASSGLPVSLSVLSGPATLSGGVLSATGSGLVTLRAQQSGNDQYAAVSADQTVSVGPAPQTLIWPNLAARTFGDHTFGVSVSANSGLQVVLSIASGKATVSGTNVTLTGAGNVSLRAEQAGNTNYAAVSEVRTFAVAKASQTLTFPTIASRAYTPEPFTPVVVTSSGLPAALEVLSGLATASGSQVTLTGIGTVIVRAKQAGNDDWEPALPSDRTFSVTPGIQTLTFPLVESKTYGDGPTTLSATSSAGLPVTFRVLSGPGRLEGTQLAWVGTGNVVVQAFQPGTTNYQAASTSQTIAVAKATQALAFSAIADRGFTTNAIALQATASSGLPVSFRVISGPATVADSNMRLSGVGTILVAADQSGDTNWLAAASRTNAFTVSRGVQTIVFSTIGDQILGTSSVTLTATANSGLPVAFQVVNGPATVSGNRLTLLNEGPVTVLARQVGSPLWLAAQIEQTFQILTRTSLKLSPLAGGTISVDPAKELYAPTETVSLTAIPAAGHEFVAWTGDLGGRNNPATLGMSTNRAVGAEFKDIAKPELSWDSPLAGTTGDENWVLSGRVTDNVAGATASWSLGEGSPKALALTADGSFRIGGLQLSVGANTVSITARDAAGNVLTEERVVIWKPERILKVADASDVQEGQRVSFSVMLTTPGDVAGLTFRLNYDKTYLTDPKVDLSAVVGQSVNSINLGEGGVISGSFSLAGTTLPVGAVPVATVSFRARSVPFALSTELAAEIESMSGADGSAFPVGNATMSGWARIKPRRIKGDNNANQRVDIGDATVISRLQVGLEERRSWDVALNDLNGTSTIDNGDTVRALRIVVGMDPQPVATASEGKGAIALLSEPEAGERLAGLAKRKGSGTGLGSGQAMSLAKSASTTPPERVEWAVPSAVPVAGQTYTVQLGLKDITNAISGVFLKIRYPVDALRLENAQSHKPGAWVPTSSTLTLWNVGPSATNYATQDGTVTVAITSQNAWVGTGGVVAELTFRVQAGLGGKTTWPLEVSEVELTGSGYDNRSLSAVTVQVPGGSGGPVTSRKLSGKVEYYVGAQGGVPGVSLNMTEGVTRSASSAADGSYTIDGPEGAENVAVTVTPSLSTDVPVANGVTTADITLIRRHVLGITPLDSPYKVLAGDVNGSDSVTTADITLIRRLILGIATNFSTGLWRFLPSDEAFSDPTKPWTASRMRRYASLAAGTLSGHDFKAIKLGDVNGSWKAPTVATGSVIKNKAKGRITIGKVRAVAGETVMIPVSLSGLDRLGSMQMTLSWDAKAASFEGVEGLGLGELNPENLGLTRVNEGLLSVSWDHPSGRVVDSKGTAGLFQLKLRTKTTTVERGEIRVTEGPTRLELTDGDVEVAASVDPGWFEIGGIGEVAADSVSLRFLGLNPDGRIELEARGPEGMKLNLEASDTLKAWAEVQSVTGQGSGNPVKVTLKPDPQFQSKFWRARVQ